MTIPTLYRRILGDQFDRLPAALREFHDRPHGGRGAGRFLIERGPGLVASIACAVARFPSPGTDVPMTLNVTVRGDRERWVRDFGGRGLNSVQWHHSGLLVERAGPWTFFFRLSADETGMRFDLRRASLLGVPLPRILSPGVSAVVMGEERGWMADIRLSFPWGAPLLRYYGLVTPEPLQESAAERDARQCVS